MAFNSFPYANLQDVNLQWLLDQMKALSKRMDDIGNVPEVAANAERIARNAESEASAANSSVNRLSARVDNIISMPAVTSENDGDFAVVVDGEWEAVTVPQAETEVF